MVRRAIVFLPSPSVLSLCLFALHVIIIGEGISIGGDKVVTLE